ncbi:hypothetical protein CALCODRAFT_341534 [Calocera cornea HHB12733]|uniref:Uncharacterized protein n=1 Tax=Calocera cornea HHB12733 TaxID=1353952 RepID=A0A165EWG2_9BASI|nr:hypothetical protein CALCODRAFT_341534 [Calocera cornea HHB12733]
MDMACELIDVVPGTAGTRDRKRCCLSSGVNKREQSSTESALWCTAESLTEPNGLQQLQEAKIIHRRLLPHPPHPHPHPRPRPHPLPLNPPHPPLCPPHSHRPHPARPSRPPARASPPAPPPSQPPALRSLRRRCLIRRERRRRLALPLSSVRAGACPLSPPWPSPAQPSSPHRTSHPAPKEPLAHQQQQTSQAACRPPARRAALPRPSARAPTP